jgi:hypothetical protein
MAGEEIGTGGAFESGGFVGFTFLLEAAKFSRFLVAAASETRFLELQIAKLLLVDEHGLDIEHIKTVGGERRDAVD